MSQLLYISKRLDRIIVEGPQNRDFAKALNSIIPTQDRKRYYGIWDISDRWFPLIKVAAEKFYIHYSCSVDADSCRDLDLSWLGKWMSHMLGEAADRTFLYGSTPTQSHVHAILFVTEDAPEEVVTAAYRALAKKHHPDRGGDESEFIRIDEAYKEIQSGF